MGAHLLQVRRPLAVLVAAAAVLSLLLMASGARAAPTTQPCADAGEKSAYPDDLVRKANGQYRRTVYLPKKAYSVTICDADGTLDRRVAYELHGVPGGGTAYLPVETETPGPKPGATMTAHAELPAADDPAFAAQWKAKLKDLVPLAPNTPSMVGRVSATAASKARRPRAKAATGAVNYQCSNPHYNLIASDGVSRLSHYPAYGYGYITALPNTSWESLVLNGFYTWGHTANNCGFGASLKNWMIQTGTTYNWSLNLGDGQNLVGGWAWPSMACGTIPAGSYLACTWTDGTWLTSAGPGGQNKYISQFDMFFDMHYCWGLAYGCYDVQSVAAHEAGHFYGLQHVGVDGDDYDDDVVMHPTTATWDPTHRTLAYGDIIGMGTFYP